MNTTCNKVTTLTLFSTFIVLVSNSRWRIEIQKSDRNNQPDPGDG